MKQSKLSAPFTWFGGKSRASDLIWKVFGNTPNYVEPFAGSLAVLLGRPANSRGLETINDLDCYLINFWRAVSKDPKEVAKYAEWPCSEVDQNARHLWLVKQKSFRERMNVDPDYFDAKVAGYWVWGQCLWIGTGWCDQKFWRGEKDGSGKIHKKLIHQGGGKGINRKLPAIGNSGRGINRQLPHVGGGRGINRQIPHLSSQGQGLFGATRAGAIQQWFEDLKHRLRDVRICCGDWKRVLTPAVTTAQGVTAVLLDPPYGGDNNQHYAVGTKKIADDVQAWAIKNGENRDFRIALCGYEGDYAGAFKMPGNWTKVEWIARKGYQSDPKAGHRERIWFSPYCKVRQWEKLIL